MGINYGNSLYYFYNFSALKVFFFWEKFKKRKKERERVEKAQNKARIALEYLYEYYSATSIIQMQNQTSLITDQYADCKHVRQTGTLT